MEEKQSDLELFSTLFERFKKPYIQFAYSYVRNMNEAEDIYMNVMMHFWETRKELPEKLHLPSYLLTSIKNQALNSLRKLNIRTEIDQQIADHKLRELNFRIESLEACNPSDLFADEILNIIKQTLNDLPEYTKRIFYMSRYDNKTNKEIAEELSVSIKTVEYHINKALKLFRVNLRDYLILFLVGLI